jgi:hypothetical protein
MGALIGKRGRSGKANAAASAAHQRAAVIKPEGRGAGQIHDGHS